MKPKLNMNEISRIPNMTEKELDKAIRKKSKESGWKND